MSGVDTIVFHHIVGDAEAAIARFRKPNEQASSTYVIGSDGQVYYVVSKNRVPYTNGSYEWNKRSITIEHAGGLPSVPYTEKMYKASENLVRSLRSQHNIKNFKRHRDISATACPGGLDVERIVKNSGKDEMYKGHTAKYWYEKYTKARAERNSFLGLILKIKSLFKK
jgi:N-acetyl-anhydromuramyl-L-alanine amidase AmpD